MENRAYQAWSLYGPGNEDIGGLLLLLYTYLLLSSDIGKRPFIADMLHQKRALKYLASSRRLILHMDIGR